MIPLHEATAPPRTPRRDAGHAPRPDADELAGRLEGYIERKACGRIRDLRVVCRDDLIILEGRARTYHAKQIAQEATENPELVQTAPHTTRMRRLDETTAARKPVLRWKTPAAANAVTADTAVKEW